MLTFNNKLGAPLACPAGHINPDHFLQTPEGRIVTPDRNELAWKRCYELLPSTLASAARSSAPLYILVGAQGSGKSTWAAAQMKLEPCSVIFDAILVKRSERAPILALAREFGVQTTAVLFLTPLVECIARNRARRNDEVVPEQAICNVFSAIEIPTLDEGFAQVLRIEDVPPTKAGRRSITSWADE